MPYLDRGITWSGQSRTSDAGQTWAALAGLQAATDGLYPDPGVTDRWWGFLIATRFIRRSNDFGSTWANYGNAIPAGMTLSALTNNLLRKANNTLLLTGFLVAPGRLMVARSADEAVSWAEVQIDTGLGDATTCNFSIRETQDGSVLVLLKNEGQPSGGAGCVYRSADDGLTWAKTKQAENLQGVNALFVIPGTNTVLLCEGQQVAQPIRTRVFRSTDAGATWGAAVLDVAGGAQVLDQAWERAHAFARVPSGRIVFLRRFYSDDNGVTWTDTGFVLATPRSHMMPFSAAACWWSSDADVTPDRSTDGLAWAASPDAPGMAQASHSQFLFAGPPGPSNSPRMKGSRMGFLLTPRLRRRRLPEETETGILPIG